MSDQQPDEYHGKGGSYVIDPDTGLRRPAEPAENEQPVQHPSPVDEYHGKGGSYIIDPATGKPTPHTGREHLLIKPARPPVPAKPKSENQAQPITQPVRNKKTKRGAIK